MKKHLVEIDIIRPVLIIILILRHSFTIYSGGWNLPDGIEKINVYYWLHELCFPAMLETFVFISGYVLAFQLFEQKKIFTFKSVLISKFKRLILPCIVFSLVYYLLFCRDQQFNLLSLIYGVLSGMGHLWFLPMIFFVILASLFLYRIKIDERLKLFILFLLGLISYLPLPFRLDRSMYFFFFFYFSFYVWNNRDRIIKYLVNGYVVIGGLILLLVVIMVQTILKTELIDYISNNELSICFKAICISTNIFFKFISSFIGVLWMYISVMFLLKNNFMPSVWFVRFNNLCMGIFIFHQFILELFYYYTDMPMYCGSYYLPWVCFFLTLIISISFTYLGRKSSLIRKLL